MYALIKDSSSLTILSVKGLKFHLITSTVGAENPSYGPSPPITIFSEKLRSIPSAVISYLPRIMLYLPLVGLSL